MKSKGLFRPLVLAAVLAAGFAPVWWLAGTWVVEIGAYVAQGEVHEERATFLLDGTPLVEVQDGSAYGDRHYRDLDGNPVPPPPNEGWSWQRSCVLPATLPDRPGDGDVSWDQRLRSFADGRAPAGFWYFVADGRLGGAGYFVGYDSRTKARIGFLGTAGFTEGPVPPAECIPFCGATWGPQARVIGLTNNRAPTTYPNDRPVAQSPHGSVSSWDVYVLGRGGKVYHADLQNRAVDVIRDEPRLRSAAIVSGVPDPQWGTPYHLAVRTDDAVLLLDAQGGLRKPCPIPEDLRERSLSMLETSAGDPVVYWNSPSDPLLPELEYRICRVGADGRLHEATVTLPNSRAGQSPPVLAVVTMPSPLLLGGFVGTWRTQELLEEGLAPTYQEALAVGLAQFRPAFVAAWFLSVLLALACYRRQARYGAGKTERWVWPLFVLVTGLPGWIGYRFGRSWPVLEPCPSCNLPVPRDRAGCARCASEFPRPALKGTEVFA